MWKYWLNHSLPFLFISLFVNAVMAQNTDVLFDSISVASFDHKILKFTLNDSLLKEVSFSLSHPKHAKIKTKHILGDAGQGMLSLISGFSLENSKNDTDLKLKAKIKSKESKSGWEIDLFCKGEIGKEFDRYRTEEGGHSLSIDHFAQVNWDKGVSGEIKKENSKIGEFILIKYPKNADISSKGPIEFLDEFKKKSLKEKDLEANHIQNNAGNDFAIIGELYGVDFKVVTNMRKQKYWVFQDQIIKSILQTSDKRNSFGNNYHLLIHPEMSIREATYWMKITLVAAFLNRTISSGYYTW